MVYVSRLRRDACPGVTGKGALPFQNNQSDSDCCCWVCGYLGNAVALFTYPQRRRRRARDRGAGCRADCARRSDRRSCAAIHAVRRRTAQQERARGRRTYRFAAHPRVPQRHAIVLGTGRRESISEAIDLLGIGGGDAEATLEQRFDDGAMRQFDSDVNRTRLSPSYIYELRGHFGKARASMRKMPFTKALSAIVSDADAVTLGCRGVSRVGIDWRPIGIAPATPSSVNLMPDLIEPPAARHRTDLSSAYV